MFTLISVILIASSFPPKRNKLARVCSLDESHLMLQISKRHEAGDPPDIPSTGSVTGKEPDCFHSHCGSALLN